MLGGSGWGEAGREDGLGGVVPGQRGLPFLPRALALAGTGYFASGCLVGRAASYLLLIVFEGAVGHVSLLRILSSILSEETRRGGKRLVCPYLFQSGA